MRMSRPSFALLALCGVCLLSGCAWHLHKRPAAAAVPAGPQRVGMVAVVNEAGRFVLVDVGSLYTPAAGTALKSFSDGTETGVLAGNPERRRPFIVADIVKGQPRVGYQVEE